MASVDRIKSGIARKFPTYRKSKFITVHSWLLGKHVDDEADGLWRVYNSLYDLTDFARKHPGGEFWIRETKGTDITEAFEAHHLTNAPYKMLENYKIRDAEKPRNYTLTLADDGFYKTLKRRVIAKLKTIDHKPKATSDFIHTGLLLATFAAAIASLKFNSLLCLGLAGAFLCWTTIAAHNYFHRRDNWRMVTFNLSMMNFNAWRISHALSHHIYPNSLYDLELSMMEPFLCWLPSPHFKSLFWRYISWITEPIAYTITLPLQLLLRLIYSMSRTNIMYWDDLICLSLPLSLLLGTNCSIWLCLQQWILITLIASFAFGVIGFNAAHHDPEIYHDGDTNREDRDWGLFQVDTIIDRGDLKGSQFLVLTHFGDHALHHLFPTLDHGILPQLYDILYETLGEFKGQLREQNHFQHIIGQHKQLLRTTPNLKPPSFKVK